MDDVIIIGGSFAGLAAALQLGRARRKVTVLDTGLPRNRFAGHSHGLLGHDHKPPLDILAEARQQLARYPTIRLINARADSITGAIDDFSVLTADGESLEARRLILSYGVVDQMPDVRGFAEGWGTSIVPCPYCDGFEVAGQHWGLVWSGPHSHNSVRLFHDWTDKLSVFADGHDIPPDIRADLARRHIPVVDGRIIEITSAAKPACPASTPPVTSPTPSSWSRSPWHPRRARWRVSSPSSRCWFESSHNIRMRSLKKAEVVSLLVRQRDALRADKSVRRSG
jgi:thioredoxin reductase